MMKKSTTQTQVILNRIQAKFPISHTPYRELAQELDIPELELIKIIKELKQRKLIRRLGAVFDTPRLGFVSALIGLKVASRNLDSVGKIIAKYSMVTHCYVRGHELNLWFTLTCKSKKELNQTVSQIAKLNGIQELLYLPAIKTFKIRTEFKIK
jgi:DNA-binding Lrp family transcriptional regulator